MRISDWSSDVCSSDLEFGEHIGIKSDADACPATCRIFKSDFAEMLLDDLLDDREAQPRTLLPGRHVRFDNPVALGGQSNTVVLNGNSQLAFLIIVQPHLDTEIGRASCRERVCQYV